MRLKIDSHALSSTLANFDWPDVPNLQVFRARPEFLTVPGAPGTVKKFACPGILQHFAHWRPRKLAKVELRSARRRRCRCARLEGWSRVDALRPSFETHRSAILLGVCESFGNEHLPRPL